MVIINPGSGPVAKATVEHAIANMNVFIADLRDAGHDVKCPLREAEDRGDGRWSFRIIVDDVDHEVEMPGIWTAGVRWMDEPDQDIWDFPRLYVDGSSWVWKYALSVCGENDDE